MTKIYLLKDPNTRKIVYVGKTKDSLQVRLKGHISYAFRKLHLNGKHEWIRNLYNSGILPIIENIEEVIGEEWIEREKYWIEFYSQENELFNKTNGGEDFVFKSGNNPWNKGGGDDKYSTETRIKMSNSAKTKNVTPEELAAKNAKVSQIMKERGRRPSQEAIEIGSKLRQKKILEYNLEGSFIKEWESVSQAAEFFNSTTSLICRCCKKKIKTCNKRIFRYFSENYPQNLNF